MTDNETSPIEVTGNEASTDPLKLALANLVVVLGAATALSGFVSNRDLAGFIVWTKTNEGTSTIAAAVSLAGIAYTWWKSRHRARQVVSVAGDARVPANVAKLR